MVDALMARGEIASTTMGHGGSYSSEAPAAPRTTVALSSGHDPIGLH